MVERLGNVVYWLCCAVGLAAIMGALALVAFSEPTNPNLPFIDRYFTAFAALVFATLSYLFGRAVKYVLAGK